MRWELDVELSEEIEARAAQMIGALGSSRSLRGDLVWQDTLMNFDQGHLHPSEVTWYLIQIVLADCADDEAMAEIVEWAWREGQPPALFVARNVWLALFRELGSLGATAPEAGTTVTLYRGAPEPYRAGLSWTTTPGGAREFHECVWRAEVSRDQLLSWHDKENEYVVDTTSLSIRRYVTAES